MAGVLPEPQTAKGATSGVGVGRQWWLCPNCYTTVDSDNESKTRCPDCGGVNPKIPRWQCSCCYSTENYEFNRRCMTCYDGYNPSYIAKLKRDLLAEKCPICRQNTECDLWMASDPDTSAAAMSGNDVNGMSDRFGESWYNVRNAYARRRVFAGAMYPYGNLHVDDVPTPLDALRAIIPASAELVYAFPLTDRECRVYKVHYGTETLYVVNLVRSFDSDYADAANEWRRARSGGCDEGHTARSKLSCIVTRYVKKLSVTSMFCVNSTKDVISALLTVTSSRDRTQGECAFTLHQLGCATGSVPNCHVCKLLSTLIYPMSVEVCHSFREVTDAIAEQQYEDSFFFAEDPRDIFYPMKRTKSRRTRLAGVKKMGQKRRSPKPKHPIKPKVVREV